MLEGFSILRPGHRLSYRGTYPLEFGGVGELHWFQQIGEGALPYEYWVDGAHRVVMAVTLARAYILDDEAEAKTAKSVDYYQREFAKGGGAK